MRPDGTASMHVQLDFFGSLLYGPEMTLELSWNVKDDVMSHAIIGGSPKKNVDRMIRDYGDSRHYRIVELNDELLLLEDFEDTPTTYRWVRPEREGETATQSRSSGSNSLGVSPDHSRGNQHGGTESRGYVEKTRHHRGTECPSTATLCQYC
jgi:hypothetical protein